MELQVSYSICAKVSTKSILRRKANGDTRDTEETVSMERRGGDRGRDMPGSYPYAGKYTVPPKMSVAGFMGYLKGKSSLMIYQKWGNMKFAYRNREFWCKGYYVDTVGKNTAAIKEYIANQLKKDKESEQLSIFDPRDPFTGSK